MNQDQATPAVESQDPATDLLDALDTSPPEKLDEADDAPESDEPEDGEAPEEDDDESPKVEQKFRVKIKDADGADVDRDLSLEELAQGYMQSADYTRKTQAAAAQEKQRQEQFYEAVDHTSKQSQQQLAALEQMVMATAAPEFQNVNWQQLAMEDPARYVQLQARQQQLQQVIGHLRQQGQQAEQQRQAVEGQRREQAMRHSIDYLSREIPGFNLEKESKALKEVGRQYGLSDAELSGITDGRFVHMLHDAAQWRKAQAGKPKVMAKVAEAPRVIKPAAPQPRKTNQASLERLKSTGRASELINFL